MERGLMLELREGSRRRRREKEEEDMAKEIRTNVRKPED
jgi:hypothetical protein